MVNNDTPLNSNETQEVTTEVSRNIMWLKNPKYTSGPWKDCSDRTQLIIIRTCNVQGNRREMTCCTKSIQHLSHLKDKVLYYFVPVVTNFYWLLLDRCGYPRSKLRHMTWQLIGIVCLQPTAKKNQWKELFRVIMISISFCKWQTSSEKQWLWNNCLPHNPSLVCVNIKVASWKLLKLKDKYLVTMNQSKSEPILNNCC